MTNIVSLDCETTTYSTGNPYDSRNKLCVFGIHAGDGYETYKIEYDDFPYGTELRKSVETLRKADVIVLFNAKFDLNWLRRYGVDYREFRIWDCQLAHFIITNQKNPYPSLNQVAEYYGLGTKIDKIAEYWEQGIQTTDIPYEELVEYLNMDLLLTYQIYFKQQEELESKPHLRKLLNISMVDTLVLADMEWNGMKYDFTLSKNKAETLTEQIREIDKNLYEICSEPGCNWNSNDHLSAILYGGTLKLPYREKYEKILKDGTVRERERNSIREVVMPQLVAPLKGTECAKEGYWKTSEDILRALKAKGVAKRLIELVLQRSLLDKELNTYAEGLPKLYEEKHYTDEIIHGQFNQCVARTGRLSSSKPNLQNLSGAIKECFISRY